MWEVDTRRSRSHRQRTVNAAIPLPFPPYDLLLMKSFILQVCRVLLQVYRSKRLVHTYIHTRAGEFPHRLRTRTHTQTLSSLKPLLRTSREVKLNSDGIGGVWGSPRPDQ
jgi:hypothetical protein